MDSKITIKFSANLDGIASTTKDPTCSEISLHVFHFYYKLTVCDEFSNVVLVAGGPLGLCDSIKTELMGFWWA